MQASLIRLGLFIKLQEHHGPALTISMVNAWCLSLQRVRSTRLKSIGIKCISSEANDSCMHNGYCVKSCRAVRRKSRMTSTLLLGAPSATGFQCRCSAYREITPGRERDICVKRAILEFSTLGDKQNCVDGYTISHGMQKRRA